MEEKKLYDFAQLQKGKNIELSPWEKLGNAVVIQAARDYELLNAKENKNEIEKKEIRLLIKFFNSGQINRFTKADGKMILQKLNKKIGVKKWKIKDWLL